ncbi:MAG: carbohydrate ABC transporter permease [Chloroflexota bacterium]
MRVTRAATLERLRTNATLAVVCLVWAVPLLWALGTSVRSPRQPVGTGWFWLPGKPTLENFSEAWSDAPFLTYYVNTIIICAGILAVQLVTISLAGYVFARVPFRGRGLLFGLFIVQLMLPISVLAVPNFLTMRDLHMASGFGVFLMRQAFRNIPVELEDASKLDGARWWQVLLYIYLPLTRPALIAFSVVSVTFHWNDFLWPLLVTNSPTSRPLTVGLASFASAGENGAQFALIMAGTVLVMAPILIGFFIFQRQFVNSFIRSGIR